MGFFAGVPPSVQFLLCRRPRTMRFLYVFTKEYPIQTHPSRIICY